MGKTFVCCMEKVLYTVRKKPCIPNIGFKYARLFYGKYFLGAVKE